MEDVVVSSSKKRLGPYRDQLMLSEWLVDIPADFSTQWLLVVCPVGRRGLVVASKVHSTTYKLNCSKHVMNAVLAGIDFSLHKEWPLCQ